ncbi:MAG: hypothetical protein IKL47_08660 [Clostridia bacterium]|nr:hypothetical protein [Clostridia bacterium]
MKKFFKQINNAVIGGLSCFIFFILGFIWWLFSPEYKVSMWALSVVIILCYLICIIIYGISSMKQQTTIYRLPAIKSIKNVNGTDVFIVEKNDLFNQGSYATICYQEDEESLEIVLGLGYVQSINSAGYLQIVVESLFNTENVSEIYSKIENTAFYRKSIKIKPSVDKNLFEEVL